MSHVCRRFVVLSQTFKMHQSLHAALDCHRICQVALQELANTNSCFRRACESSINSLSFIECACLAPMPCQPDPNSVFFLSPAKNTAEEEDVCLYLSPEEPYVRYQKPMFSKQDVEEHLFQQAVHYQSMLCGWLERAGQAQNAVLHLQEWALSAHKQVPLQLLSRVQKASDPVFGVPYENTRELLTKNETNPIFTALQSCVKTLSSIQLGGALRSPIWDFAPDNLQDSPESPSDSEASSDEEEVPLPFRQCHEEMRIKRKLTFRSRKRDFTTIEIHQERPLAQCSYPKRRTPLPPPLGEAVARLILQEAEDSDTF